MLGLHFLHVAPMRGRLVILQGAQALSLGRDRAMRLGELPLQGLDLPMGTREVRLAAGIVGSDGARALWGGGRGLPGRGDEGGAVRCPICCRLHCGATEERSPKPGHDAHLIATGGHLHARGIPQPAQHLSFVLVRALGSQRVSQSLNLRVHVSTGKMGRERSRFNLGEMVPTVHEWTRVTSCIAWRPLSAAATACDACDTKEKGR
jgi:hypothetical protein